MNKLCFLLIFMVGLTTFVAAFAQPIIHLAFTILIFVLVIQVGLGLFHH